MFDQSSYKQKDLFCAFELWDLYWETKRLIQEGRARNAVLDMTNGRRTKAVLIVDSGHIVLAAINPETVAGRLSSFRQNGHVANESNSERVFE